MTVMDSAHETCFLTPPRGFVKIPRARRDSGAGACPLGAAAEDKAACREDEDRQGGAVAAQGRSRP